MNIRLRHDLYTDDMCVKIYNPNEKKVIAVFPSFTKASNRLNISTKILQHNSETKKRVYSEYYKMEIAIRWGVMKEGDLELIDKTLKNKKL